MTNYLFIAHTHNFTVKLAIVSVLLPVFVLSVCAQSGARIAGEISVARAASINGTGVRSSGVSLFSNSRVSTGESGIAVLNLGKFGRMELGAKTEITVRFADGFIGGELHSGKIILSVPAGVTISLNAARGTIKSDDRQPAVLSVEAGTEKVKVFAHLGQATITLEGRTELITAGEEVAIGSHVASGIWQRRRVVTAGLANTGGATGLSIASQATRQASKPVVANAKTVTSLTGLLNTGVNFSLAQIIGNGRDPDRFFDISTVCRDKDNFLCHRRSSINP